MVPRCHGTILTTIRRFLFKREGRVMLNPGFWIANLKKIQTSTRIEISRVWIAHSGSFWCDLNGSGGLLTSPAKNHADEMLYFVESSINQVSIPRRALFFQFPNHLGSSKPGGIRKICFSKRPKRRVAYHVTGVGSPD